jgi:hypothetical protein
MPQYHHLPKIAVLKVDICCIVANFEVLGSNINPF